MRITQSMLTRNLLNNINATKESLHDLNNSISTGKRMDKASDDPMQFINSSRFKKAMHQNDQYMRNITDGTMWADATANVLDQFLAQLSNVRETAVQGADDTMDAENRQSLANQLDEVLNTMVSLANTKHMGKSIFAGTLTNADAFSFDGVSVAYHGNDGSIARKIDTDTSMDVNVSGQKLMDAQMFESIVSLRDALNNNDLESIQNSIGALDSVYESVTGLSTGNGSRQNQLDLTHQRIETANLNLASYLSQAEDVDMAEVITRYNAEEMAYQAALQTMSDVIHTNLMDFLK